MRTNEEILARQWVMNNGPQFMIIGAAKSGTTTLYSYLNDHPDIFLTATKEPEFFSSSKKYELGYEWYKELFINAPAGSAIGEASTTYSRWPHTLDSPKLIFKNTKVRKFIYIMRNPVERAFSHYAHIMRNNVSMSFEEALDMYPVIFDTGNYHFQIERYLKYFKLEDFLFITLDQLRRNPKKELSRILAHIGSSEFDFSIDQLERINKGGSSYYLRQMTVERWKKIPILLNVSRCIPNAMRTIIFETIRNSSYGKRIVSDYKLVPMKQETKNYLRNQYALPNQKLSKLTGIDISAWEN